MCGQGRRHHQGSTQNQSGGTDTDFQLHKALYEERGFKRHGGGAREMVNGGRTSGPDAVSNLIIMLSQHHIVATSRLGQTKDLPLPVSACISFEVGFYVRRGASRYG